MSGKITNILMVGVGGQGTLLASEILSEVLKEAGFDVKKSEIHGMSQRGGSVVSHVRFGNEVNSPIIPEGEADILLGFELLESYRYLPLLKKGCKLVVNDLKINPSIVSTGGEAYPEGLEEKIRQRFPDCILLDGLKLATSAGNAKTANTVLIGALSKRLDIDEKYWLAAIGKMVPPKAVEINRKAFYLGREAA
ncbi:indolepyruvate:ferredoxin oxidoreductase, beta subunit [Geotalea daltonii FRC-32]|uniref:Indolepyruvate:ferredoxin oxidoreductase, beta subunit n=1 Tax=Geotalea daltonii (strain DSM 22248 / JCM 15807 / FRC-32) TaxID=316067 RepID=B9M226_GEODF|nr:indolepyruvate oxidoreductase subunit beta [Geotalea daltonii]ACM21144.1 indolepyruvate:ferredoxin oxidoreductase, beta subunit [Geotalea daltonii FRC-32]